MADRIILTCILVLAGVYFWATTQIPTLEIGDPLGPKAFPRLLGIGLLLTAAILLAEIIRNRKIDQRSNPPDAPEEGNAGLIAGVTVVTAVFFASFELLGYVLAVTLYLLAMMNYFNRKSRWMVNVLTAVIYGVSSYFIFTKALGVNLPRGLLPF